MLSVKAGTGSCVGIGLGLHGVLGLHLAVQILPFKFCCSNLANKAMGTEQILWIKLSLKPLH